MQDHSAHFVRNAAGWLTWVNGSLRSTPLPVPCARNIWRNTLICRRASIWTNRRQINFLRRAHCLFASPRKHRTCERPVGPVLRDPQAIQRFLKIRRPGCGEVYLLSGHRVSESNFLRMQQNTRGFVAGQLREALCLAWAVGTVARDGKTEVLEVNTNLVGPAGE